MVSRAVWVVASSCWNHISSNSNSSSFGIKNLFNMVRYRSPVTVTAFPLLSSKKEPNHMFWVNSAPYGHFLWMEWCLMKNMRIVGCPKPGILFVYVSREVEMRLVGHHQFLEKIRHFVIHLQQPLTVRHTGLAVGWHQLLNHLNFVWKLLQIFGQNSLKGPPINGQLRSAFSHRSWWFLLDTIPHSLDVLKWPACSSPSRWFPISDWPSLFKSSHQTLKCLSSRRHTVRMFVPKFTLSYNNWRIIPQEYWNNFCAFW